MVDPTSYAALLQGFRKVDDLTWILGPAKATDGRPVWSMGLVSLVPGSWEFLGKDPAQRHWMALSYLFCETLRWNDAMKRKYVWNYSCFVRVAMVVIRCQTVPAYGPLSALSHRILWRIFVANPEPGRRGSPGRGLGLEESWTNMNFMLELDLFRKYMFGMDSHLS